MPITKENNLKETQRRKEANNTETISKTMTQTKSIERNNI